MGYSTKAMVSQTVQLLRDKWQAAIQALSPVDGGSSNISVGAGSTNGVLPTNAEIVRCAATGNCYLKFGFGSAPTATTSDMLFPSGSEIIVVPDGATHFAVIQAGASTGTFSMTKVE